MARSLFEKDLAPFMDPSFLTLKSVPPKPKGGFSYIFEWDESAVPKQRERWRTEGYRWRQTGKVEFDCDGYKGTKWYFKTALEKGRYCDSFTKCAYQSEKYPLKVLVVYEGDETSVVEFSHGNAKRPVKKSQPFVPTNRVVIENMKKSVDKDKYPHETFTALDREALAESLNPITHSFNGPRDVKQVRNAVQREKSLKALPSDALYLIYQLGVLETDFISDLVLLPTLVILMFNKGKTHSD
jgi:hypothetical protein